MKKILISVFLAIAAKGMAQTVVTVGGIRYLIEDDHAIVARQDKDLGGAVTIPASISVAEKTYSVEGLITPEHSESAGGGAFQECAVTSVDLSDLRITALPDKAFSGCGQLSDVMLPSTVVSIGSDAFSHCTSLTDISLPEGVNTIGHHAFFTTGLTKAVIPPGVASIEEGTFADSPITNVEIPDNITSIGEYAFANYTHIESVKMAVRDCRTITCAINAFGDMTTVDLQVPAGGAVVYKEYYPWSDMKSITEYGTDTGEVLTPDQRHVTIDGIRYLLKDGVAAVDIQPETLAGDIVIPSAVTFENTPYPVTSVLPTYWYYGSHMRDNYYTYRGAFTGTGVTSVTLPNTITKLGAFAFYQANSLKRVTLSSAMTNSGWCTLRECESLEEVVLPGGVAELSDGCFAYDPKLKTIVVPEGVTTIGGECFLGSGIETLTIPSTCRQLGYQSLELPQLKTLYVNVKEPTDLKATDYNGSPAPINGTVFGHDSDQENVRQRLAAADLIVPLGTAESYRVMSPWSMCRSVTDAGSSYLKLNGSFFAAPAAAFTINTEPEFEYHDGWCGETYTQGLNLKQGTEVTFTTVGPSWVYVYLFSSNSNTVNLDGVEITHSEIGDDKAESYSYLRYDRLVMEAGTHTITCNDYEGNQWPCMLLLEVQNVSGDYYEPKQLGVNIDGINYVLSEQPVGGETVRTATVARQSTSLGGDVVIPAKVSYAKTVLESNKWVTQSAYDYSVTDIVAAGFEVDEAPGIHRSTDGAFQDCQITSISLPATLTTIPGGTFNSCRQLKSVSLAEGITTIGAGAFANCTSLEEIYLPETVTDMSGWYIFGNCSSLKKVNTPVGVTALGNGCFMGSGIETFLIPKSLTALGEACFAAENLQNIKICHATYAAADGETPATISFPEGAFSEVGNVTLIVPQGTKEPFYSQIYPWKDFGTIVEYTDQGDEHQYNAYRVAYTEEVIGSESAGARRRMPSAGQSAPTCYVPSGVPTEQVTGAEKEGHVLIGWKNVDGTAAPEYMPAADTSMKAVFAKVGDADGDGAVTAADAMAVANTILGRSVQNFISKAADANRDGKVTIADAVQTVDIIMKKE